MATSELVTNVVSKSNLRDAQLKAFKIAKECLESAFGPYASTTAIRTEPTEKDQYGSTFYTKDGHTILKRLKLNRPIEMSAIEDVIRVTSETVKKVGDGTTSATILSYLVYKWLVKANTEFGIPENVLVKDLLDTTKMIIERIDSYKKECTPMDIFEIAIIATNGNVEVANTIKQLYEKHGMGVYIDIGISNTEEHIVKEYDGLTFNQGYYTEGFVNNREKATCEITQPSIYVFEDPVDTQEMRSFFDKIIYDNIWAPLNKYVENQKNGSKKNSTLKIVPTVIFSPAYGHDMKSGADEIMKKFAQFPIESRPPLLSVTNIHDPQALSDLCTLSGARLIKKYHNPIDQKADEEKGLAPTLESIHEFCGHADLIVADNTKTKVINPALMYAKNDDGTLVTDTDGNPVYSVVFNNLLNTCEIRLKRLEKEHKELTEIYLLKKRINSLKGNMVEYLVGGVSTADRDVVKDLVEDAVLNCRSAATDGVGYGANFEAFRAVSELADEKMVGKDSYSMLYILKNVYTELTDILYATAFNGNTELGHILTAASYYKYSCPCNLVELNPQFKNGEYNLSENVLNAGFNSKRPVLNSIKSDEVILNAIAKIISISFASNQYIVPAPQYNIYTDDTVVAIKE